MIKKGQEEDLGRDSCESGSMPDFQTNKTNLQHFTFTVLGQKCTQRKKTFFLPLFFSSPLKRDFFSCFTLWKAQLSLDLTNIDLM